LANKEKMGPAAGWKEEKSSPLTAEFSYEKSIKSRLLNNA